MLPPPAKMRDAAANVSPWIDNQLASAANTVATKLLPRISTVRLEMAGQEAVGGFAARLCELRCLCGEPVEGSG